MNLAQKHCRPDAEKLSQVKIRELANQTLDWDLGDNLLETQLKFESFGDAIEFVNRVAEIAEQENHHPDICISYRDVALTLTTHQAGGLTGNDFIMAAKIDELVTNSFPSSAGHVGGSDRETDSISRS